MLIIHTDGACLGNPGPMGIGVAIWQNGKLVKEISEYIGNGTNNIAEYSAVLRALEEAKKLGATEVIVKADSELVVRQLQGKYQTKNKGLKPLKRKIDAFGLEIKIKFQHVPREENKIADRLSKRAIEQRIS